MLKQARLVVSHAAWPILGRGVCDPSQFAENVYLVCRIVRVGKMNPSDKEKSSFNFRRPFGAAVFDVRRPIEAGAIGFDRPKSGVSGRRQTKVELRRSEEGGTAPTPNLTQAHAVDTESLKPGSTRRRRRGA